MTQTKFLFEQIIDYENIRIAWVKARKGKTSKLNVFKFGLNLNKNLEIVKENLTSKPAKLSSYNKFKIFDPKERIISVVPFIDRVMHHAIINILEPIFEKHFIYHTYACRKNKGTHKAVLYSYKMAKKSSYYLKLDVKKYFDNINHNILKKLLKKLIKEKRCLELLNNIIDSYGCYSSEKGLPIGNLTSQFFANFYLSNLDHYILEVLKPKGYVRYMDDFVLFSDSKQELKKCINQIKQYCLNNLCIELNPFVLCSCKNGLPFLGFLVKKSGIFLSQKTKIRKRKKLKQINYELSKGIITEEKYIARVKCLYSSNSLFSYKSI